MLRCWLPLVLASALLPGCSASPTADAAACLGGGQRCAAAQAPAGMRQVRRGHRIRQAHWLPRRNKESGLPDIGIQADWTPITERR